MINESIKKELIELIMYMGIPMVGFAPVSRWSNPPDEIPNKFSEWIPEEFWPQSIYPETKTVIVIGLPVHLPIVETAPSIHYHELYRTVNTLLDIRAYEISNFLTQNGYPSINLPRDGYGDIEVLLKKPLAFFSHKHAAYLAGLGSFGENTVLLTKEYGPRVRFTSIFTSAEIKGDPIILDDLCIHCKRCESYCPVNAIKAMDKYTIKPIDKISCATRSKQLRKEFRSPCGICIKVCPIGEDRKKFNRQDMSIYGDLNNKYQKSWDHIRKYGTH